MTAERLRVGLPISQSGQFSLQGEQVLAGVTCWVQWVNERGGVTVADGQQLPVELIQYDDESHPPTAADLTRRLIQDDEVDILFGPYSSRLTLAAAPIADANEVVLWNHSGATDALYDKGFGWLVSVLSPASRYFHGLLDMIQQINQSASRVGMFWSSSGTFGHTVVSGAKRRARELGYSIVEEQSWEPPLDDATAILESLRETDPHLVLVAGSFDDDTTLVQELVAEAIRMKAIGVVAAGISEFGEQLGKTAAGVFGPSQWEPNPSCAPDHGPSPEEVVELFETTDVQPTDYPAAQAFATGIVIEACLTANDTSDPVSETVDQRRLRRTAETADFTTFFGRFQIDPETGKQVGHTPAVVQWHDGKKRGVWPEERRQATPRYPTHWDNSS
jgi:branched-chain amino acid transport system substrate-binding protein